MCEKLDRRISNQPHNASSLKLVSKSVYPSWVGRLPSSRYTTKLRTTMSTNRHGSNKSPKHTTDLQICTPTIGSPA